MSEKSTMQIDLPEFYLQINTMRQAQGLAPVEPAMMALRASIRFAVVQHRHLDLKANQVELDLDDVDVLCEVIEGLFNVHPKLGGLSPHGEPEEADEGPRHPQGETLHELPLPSLYEAINEQRRAEKRIPVEAAVVAVRVGVKFLMLRHRPLDFKGHRLLLDHTDIEVLEQILADQFAVTLPGGLIALCDTKAVSTPAADLLEAPAVKRGWIARLWHRIGSHHIQRRRYQLDTTSLLLAISQQRAVKGYKPLPPSEIKRRCGERISLELKLESDFDSPDLTLTKEQLDTVAAIIREEFNVILKSLDGFTGKTSH
jgi:hypothetical protein